MVRHFEVRGYAREETSEFLRSQGVALGPEIVATLHEKTDGLPLAILLFTIFIRDFATDPVDLLSGDIAADSRLQQWFDDVISRVTESERRLLRILSVHGGLFNKGLVTGVAKRMNIESSQSAFLGLQSRFLVQQYTPYRWKVHHLIRLYALQQLVDDEQRAILTFFGEHSLGGIIGLRAARYSQDQVQQVVRAINFFQRARDWSRSQELLSSVSRAIKKHGLYGMLIGPAEIQSHEGRQRDTWLDYNLAHCYFITGALKRAFEICERLVTTIPLDQPDKRVAVVRLYAELLASVGRHAVGLQKLQEVLAAGTVRALPHTILAHARSVEVMLQTATGDIESAWANSETLLSHAQERKDKRGTAVALTRRGLIEMQRARFREALPAFKESVRLFGEVGDNRGRAWAMMYASECLFEVGDTINGESMLVDGLIIKADIGETSTDYKNLLTRIQKRPLTTASLERLTQEMGRLSLAMSSSTGGI
jgi:ATP/maltotriose-dependent transcriptional regulator MalT